MTPPGSTEASGSPSMNHQGTPFTAGTTIVSGPIKGFSSEASAGQGRRLDGDDHDILLPSAAGCSSAVTGATNCSPFSSMRSPSARASRSVSPRARTLTCSPAMAEPGRDPSADRAGADDANVHGAADGLEGRRWARGSPMIFRQSFEPQSSAYTYLIGCEDSGEALLIDPVLEAAERDLAAAFQPRADAQIFDRNAYPRRSCHRRRAASRSYRLPVRRPCAKLRRSRRPRNPRRGSDRRRRASVWSQLHARPHRRSPLLFARGRGRRARFHRRCF